MAWSVISGRDLGEMSGDLGERKNRPQALQMGLPSASRLHKGVWRVPQLTHGERTAGAAANVNSLEAASTTTAGDMDELAVIAQSPPTHF